MTVIFATILSQKQNFSIFAYIGGGFSFPESAPPAMQSDGGRTAAAGGRVFSAADCDEFLQADAPAGQGGGQVSKFAHGVLPPGNTFVSKKAETRLKT